MIHCLLEDLFLIWKKIKKIIKMFLNKFFIQFSHYLLQDNNLKKLNQKLQFQDLYKQDKVYQPFKIKNKRKRKRF